MGGGDGWVQTESLYCVEVSIHVNYTKVDFMVFVLKWLIPL